MSRYLMVACCFWLIGMIVTQLYGQDSTALQIAGSSVKEVATREIKSPTGALLRSMILPGWGQLYNRKPLKALLIGGVQIGLAVDIVVQNQLAQKATTANEKMFYVNNRNLAMWYLAAVILYSMADAYVDAHLFDFDESPNLSYSPTTVGEETFALGFRLSINF